MKTKTVVKATQSKRQAQGAKHMRTVQRGASVVKHQVALAAVSVAGYVTGAWQQLLK